MYNYHVRGKLDRYKVRFRSYVLSGDSFLEVKHKIPTGKTFKRRIECDGNKELSSEMLSLFPGSNFPKGYCDFRPVLINKFTRITLVNKELNERCTIDMDISYKKNGNVKVLENFVVVEVKSDLNGIKTHRYKINKVDYLKDVVELTAYYFENGNTKGNNLFSNDLNK